MSSSSYLGHGAKYWAEKYFEQQTQTRMPDDSSPIDWKSKYFALEKIVLFINPQLLTCARRSLICAKRTHQNLKFQKLLIGMLSIDSEISLINMTM